MGEKKKKNKERNNEKIGNDNNTSNYKKPHAPYNFVRINRKNIVIDPIPDCETKSGKYSEISDSLYNGEIRYQIKAETPIFVDNGKDEGEGKDFFKNKDGKYALPGSTIRGLIRSNVQMLSLSDIKDDIDDCKLMYRAVSEPSLKRDYKYILGDNLENVKSGCIKNDHGKYYIYCRKESQNIANDGSNGNNSVNSSPNYYKVDEKYALENKDAFRDVISEFQNSEYYIATDRQGNPYWAGVENHDYVPHWHYIGYKLNNEGKVIAIKAVCPDEEKLEEGYLPGYLISSGRVQRKRAFFVIPYLKPEEMQCEPIPKEDIKAYQVDYNRRENTLGTDKNKKNHNEKQKQIVRDFYKLPREGEKRPVFYVKKDGRLYFGYTPHLRVIYKYSIYNGLGLKEQIEDKSQNKDIKDPPKDFTNTIFGCSSESLSAKSKVFFTDAILSTAAETTEKKNVVLLEPKPTSYLEYLGDDNHVETYNNDSFKIRGIKQYWLHRDVAKNMTGNDNKSIGSTLHFIEPGNSFEGAIRFQNLSEKELGLLLWSIILEEGCSMNVGKGKPYGYGRIKFENVRLTLLQPKIAYQAASDAFLQDSMEDHTEKIKTFIDYYKNFLKNELNIEDLMNNETISDFLHMKTLLDENNEEYTQYMTLDRVTGYPFFKQERKPLPTVDTIWKKYSKQGRKSTHA